MKIGTKDGRTGLSLLIALAALAALLSCGRSSSQDEAVPPILTGGEDEDTLTEMRGHAAFGSTCGGGFITDPTPVKLDLWSCPVNIPWLELAEPIQPVFLTADCARKTLTIRSEDRSVNTTWEIMPDASFNIYQDGLFARLKADGNGNTGCFTPILMKIWGKVQCGQSRDQARIRFETVMWLNRRGDDSNNVSVPIAPITPSPVPRPSDSPGNPPGRPPTPSSGPTTPPATRASDPAGPQCKLPPRCYFHTIGEVNQCT